MSSIPCSCLGCGAEFEIRFRVTDVGFVPETPTRITDADPGKGAIARRDCPSCGREANAAISWPPIIVHQPRA